MKAIILSFLLIIGLSADNPTSYGHEVKTEVCQCAKPFKDTKAWTQGSRSGYFCITTSEKTGKQYKRYFSQWLKLKNR